jgi:hypothetical protein
LDLSGSNTGIHGDVFGLGLLGLPGNILGIGVGITFFCPGIIRLVAVGVGIILPIGVGVTLGCPGRIGLVVILGNVAKLIHSFYFADFFFLPFREVSNAITLACFIALLLLAGVEVPIVPVSIYLCIISEMLLDTTFFDLPFFKGLKVSPPSSFGLCSIACHFNLTVPDHTPDLGIRHAH